MISEIPPKNDTEIEIFELLKIVLRRKYLLIISIILGLLLGCSYILVNGSEYHSKLAYSINTAPPFYSEKKIFSDFDQFFFSNTNFDLWKKDNQRTLINFDVFNNTKIIEGFKVSKEIDENLVLVNMSQIIIKTKSLDILDDFYSYVNFINFLLKQKYTDRANVELQIIKNRLDESSKSDNILGNLFQIDRFLSDLENGSEILHIKWPTYPKEVSANTFQIIIICSVLGGVIGLIIIFILEVMLRYKKHFNK